MKLYTFILTVSLALLHAYYIQADEGYGYGPSYGGYDVEEDYDYGEEEDLKKKLGTAAAIAVPIAVGVGVGSKLLKKKFPLLALLSPLNPLNPLNALNPLNPPNPLAALGTLGLLNALKPNPLNPLAPPVGGPLNPLNPLNGLANLLKLPGLGIIRILSNSNAAGPTIGVPSVFPGASGLAPGNPQVPLFNFPTPFGGISFGFNKRSVDEQEKHDKCGLITAATMWNVAILADKDNLCIPKAFCTLMANRTTTTKPRNVIEKEMMDYINSQVHGDEKALLKRSNENIILYSAALGTYSKSVARCAEVFDHCSEGLDSISEEAEKLLD